MGEDEPETQEQRDFWRSLRDPMYITMLEFKKEFEKYQIEVAKKDKAQAAADARHVMDLIDRLEK